MNASGTRRQEHGQRAEADEERRQQLAPRGVMARHAGCLGVGDGDGQPASRARHAPDEQARQDVDDQRDDEQHEPDLDERVQIQIRRSASVNSLASTAAIVYCGANERRRIPAGVFPITIVTAIVSPSARPKPSMTAPTMPGARVEERGANRLEARGAERVGAFALCDGHRLAAPRAPPTR